MPRQALLAALETSPATLTRDITYLRDRHNMPVVYDAEHGGYRLDAAAQLAGTQYELPGLWFSAEEIHALLTLQHLLANLGQGSFLQPYGQALVKRLEKLLGNGSHAHAQVARRIRVLSLGARKLDIPHFQMAAHAVLKRCRLQLRYLARHSGEVTEREVSPQRLVHYRENWKLDAWCHRREQLRSFSVDAILQARVLGTPAIDLPDAELDDVLGRGYGIFSGQQLQWACLRFTPTSARWVATERWHPDQHGRFDAQGHWLLELPYTDPRELVMDILRHVPDVEVLWPEELAEEVQRRLRAGLERMAGAG